MSKKFPRLEEIRYLINVHNITPTLLAHLTPLKRGYIRSIITRKRGELDLNTYSLLKTTIIDIVEGRITKEQKGVVRERIIPQNPNRDKLRQILTSNNIKFVDAAEVSGFDKRNFQNMLSESRRYDISDERFDYIISELKKHYNLSE